MPERKLDRVKIILLSTDSQRGIGGWSPNGHGVAASESGSGSPATAVLARGLQLRRLGHTLPLLGRPGGRLAHELRVRRAGHFGR